MSGLIRRLFLMFFIALALFAIIGLILPSEWRIERSIVIAATPEAIHEHVGDLKRWRTWTPWNTTVDETLKVSYGETTSGPGAFQNWSGETLGDGEIRFIESSPSDGVTYHLSFSGGEMQSKGAIRYETVEGGTKVTWNDGGETGYNLLQRYVGYFLLDDYAGAELEKRLSALKKVVEKPQSDSTP